MSEPFVFSRSEPIVLIKVLKSRTTAAGHSIGDLRRRLSAIPLEHDMRLSGDAAASQGEAEKAT